MKTGIKFKPCNVGTAEAHNRRDKAYCQAVAHKFGHTYFWDEYRHLNLSWRNPSYPQSLPELLEELKVLVKDKTNRSMQCKPVEYTDRKTGKKKSRAGSSAIREGCPPIKPDTKIEDFDLFVKWLADKGITVISIDLHHDEGHPDPETDNLLPNHHAHIIVDWMDHQTGKSIKLDNEDCKEMQTVLAESLGMERGTPKQDTGIEGLSAIEYKERKARENHKRLTAENAALEQQIEDKRDELDKENGNAVLSGIANVLGFGKFKETDKRNKELEASVPAKIAELQAKFEAAVEAEAEKRTDHLAGEIFDLTERNRQLEAQKMRQAEQDQRQKKEIVDLKQQIVSERNMVDSRIAVAVNNATKKQKSEIDDLNYCLSWRDSLMELLGNLLYQSHEIFRKAIDAIVKFASWVMRGPGGERYKSIFEPEDAKNIKLTMLGFAKSEEDQTTIGKWLLRFAEKKADKPFVNGAFFNAEKEIEDVATGRYDRMIGMGRSGGMGV